MLRWVPTAPLGFPGRARGVEDGGVVLGLDGHVGQGDVAASSDVAHQVGERRRRAPATPGRSWTGRPVLVGDHHRPQVGELGEVGQQAVEAAAVDEGHGGARVGRPYWSSGLVHHALSGTTTPPAAAAPQKAMAHSGRLRMAMATRSPFSTPKRSRSARAMVAADAEVLLVGGALVLVDEVVLVAVAARELEDHPQAGGAVLPHPGDDAADLDVLHLEHLPGGGDGPRRLLDRHRTGSRPWRVSLCGFGAVGRGRRRRQAPGSGWPAGAGVARRRRPAAVSTPRRRGRGWCRGRRSASMRSRISSDRATSSGPEGAGHLLHGAGADDGRRHRRMGEDEGQGQVAEGDAGVLGHRRRGPRWPRAWR